MYTLGVGRSPFISDLGITTEKGAEAKDSKQGQIGNMEVWNEYRHILALDLSPLASVDHIFNSQGNNHLCPPGKKQFNWNH